MRSTSRGGLLGARACCQLVAAFRVNPVPGSGRGDQVEDTPRTGPVLKPHLDDLRWVSGDVGAGMPRERCTRFDRSHAKPTPQQRQRGFAGPGADLQDPVPGPHLGQLQQPVKQDLRVVRPGVLVQLRRRVERRPQPLSLAVLGHTRSLPHERGSFGRVRMSRLIRDVEGATASQGQFRKPIPSS
jgi:hypothetical protein